jgi:hypothetical protein
MLRHIACFKWNDTMTDEEVLRLEQLPAALPGQIPEVRAYHFGRDQQLTETTFDFGITADFDDAEGWRAYHRHDSHRDVLDFVAPRARQRVSVQFELETGA